MGQVPEKLCHAGAAQAQAQHGEKKTRSPRQGQPATRLQAPITVACANHCGHHGLSKLLLSQAMASFGSLARFNLYWCGGPGQQGYGTKGYVKYLGVGVWGLEFVCRVIAVGAKCIIL